MKKYLLLTAVVLFVFGNTACSSDRKGAVNSNESELILKADNMSSFNEIIKSEQPVLVDFYADWCAPCRMVAPILEQVAEDMKGDVTILKVNVDKNGAAAQKYGIRSIPTLMLFQNGEVRWKGVGVMQTEQIKQIVKTKALK